MEERIRALREGDLPAVMEIWLASNLEAHAFVAKEYFERKAEEVERAIAAAQVLVCESGGELLGFLGLDGPYLAGLFVRRGARGRGIGRRLLEQAKRLYPRLTLHVYRENRRALAFYRREGFRVLSEKLDAQTGRPELEMEYSAE